MNEEREKVLEVKDLTVSFQTYADALSQSVLICINGRRWQS